MNRSRRKFVKQGLGVAAISTVPSFFIACKSETENQSKEQSSPNIPPKPMTYFEHIGMQLYTARDAFAADGKATLEQIAKIGYKEIELHNAALLGEYSSIIQDLGMAVTSTHFSPPFITGKWEAYGMTEPKDQDFRSLLTLCDQYGVSHMVMPMLFPDERGDLDHYKKLAASFNEYGELCKKARVQFCYHNHNFEFAPQGDTTPMEVLLAETDPELVAFELDIFWVASTGMNPADFMKNHKNRIRLLHLKDLKSGTTPTYKTLETAQKMPEIFKEVGQGSIDFKEVLATAKEIGVTNCYVEQDHSPDPMNSLATSYQYLQELGL